LRLSEYHSIQGNVESDDCGFTGDLLKLEEALKVEPQAKVSLATLEDLLEGRGFVTLILILSLPFIQPLPVPGISIIFGLAIFMLGLRIALGRHAGLPRFLRQKEFEAATVMRLTASARKLFGKIEKLFRRRLVYLVVPPGQNMAGIGLMANGLALTLPLPPVILFSNGLPAFSVFLICLGLLERDGLFVTLGQLMAVLTWFYFGLWTDLIFETILAFPDWVHTYGQTACHFLGLASGVCSPGGAS
jgi:hypothetical protein